MSDFTRLINASDLTEWIMESFPDWCEGDVRSIINHIDDMPSAEPERFVCAEVKLSKEDIQDAVDEAVKKMMVEMEESEMSDFISRQAAIDALEKNVCNTQRIMDAIKALPSAKPEIKPISYQDCSNAMLMMCTDNVITDGEYNRIMDNLNAKHMAERRTDE